MASAILTLCCHLILFLPFSSATLRRNNLLRPPPSFESTQKPTDGGSPYRYFEVTKPIATPPVEPCSHTVLRHQFGYTYGKPPVTANYTPPIHCGTQKFSKIVLEWTATCKGRQYDRIFGVWLGGVELLRSCTAEPRASGIIWTVKKDITRYYSLLMKNNTLAVYLGNVVTSTYTGIYNATITIHFYPVGEDSDSIDGASAAGFGSNADLILPISRTPPLDDGFWFEIENSTDIESKNFTIPGNVYRAVLEVYVSFHENDEFWYTNLPNEYIAANGLSGYGGNGAFREVVVALDGDVIGSVWPFTVVFTGGINPLLWRPITGIGSFDLPSYDIEMTPFLARILDGESHEIGFSVTNALNVWYVDANLHLWIDHGSSATSAGITAYSSVPLSLSTELDFHGLDGNFSIGATRSIQSAGWVESSFGNLTTRSIQSFNYSNVMAMQNDANLQIIDQSIHYIDKVDTKTSSDSSSWTKQIDSDKMFLCYAYTDLLNIGNGTELYVTDVVLGFDEKRSSSDSVRNIQKANGTMVVKNNLVVSGAGSTEQVYRFDSGDFCYFRNVSSSNYSILYDMVEDSCSRIQKMSGISLPEGEGFASVS